MSIKIMTRLWDNSRHDGAHLLVLLALADWANSDGVIPLDPDKWVSHDGKAYPPNPFVDTLARKCRVERKRCREILDELSARDSNDPNAPEPELVILYQREGPSYVGVHAPTGHP